MTVPSPSAPSRAVCHLCCPLPSESCHLPACPGSLESDASGPGPGGGPAPGPRLVGAGRHRKKEDTEARAVFRIHGRREASTRREDLRQPHLNVASTKQDGGVEAPGPRSRGAVGCGELSDGGPADWPSGEEWTAERRECRPSGRWAPSGALGLLRPSLPVAPSSQASDLQPPVLSTCSECPVPSSSVPTVGTAPHASSVPWLPPRPSIHRQVEDDDNDTATNTRL